MAVNNNTILTKAWLSGTNDFQQRIPNPDISGYDATVSALFDPYNNAALNEFTGMLVGLMGTYVEGKLFENPLRELKKPATQFGNSERHVAVNYLKAHSYKLDDEQLLKLEKPEFKEWFYSVNQHRQYDFSWSRYELARAFAGGDSVGASDLLTTTLNQMISSDNYDEMQVMLNSFAVAEHNFGLHRQHISAAPSDKATSQELLAGIRADAGRMQFPSTRYNKLDIPTFELPQTLVLWVTPDVDAILDVMALADLFHTERAEVNFRKIVIPEFPVANIYAALTSEDFIYARDVYYGVEPPFYNPANRTWKYYLFHDQMMGVNPLANCVVYTTDTVPSASVVTMKPSALAFNPSTGTIPVGGTLATHLDLTGTVTGDSAGIIAVEPDAAIYTITAKSGDEPIALNSKTYIDSAGVLHLQKSGVRKGDIITITAKSSYINPSGATPTIQDATFTATVTDAEADPAKPTD